MKNMLKTVFTSFVYKLSVAFVDVRYIGLFIAIWSFSSYALYNYRDMPMYEFIGSVVFIGLLSMLAVSTIYAIINSSSHDK